MKYIQTFFSLLILLSFSNLSFAQDGDYLSKAKKLRGEGNLKEAIIEYQKGINANSDNYTFVYSYASTLALSKKIDSAFYYINLLPLTDTTLQVLTNPDFYFLIDDQRWEKVEDRALKNYMDLSGENIKKPNITKQLLRMVIKDQAFYNHLNVVRQLKLSKFISSAIWEAKNRINKDNLNELELIVKKIGWPKISDIGEEGAQGAFLIIQHCKDLEMQEKCLKKMKKSAQKGQTKWSDVAFLIDRVNVRSGKQQIYGTQIGMKKGVGPYPKDLFEPEYVDQRRKEVGLIPLGQYMGYFGGTWDVKQKEKKK